MRKLFVRTALLGTALVVSGCSSIAKYCDVTPIIYRDPVTGEILSVGQGVTCKGPLGTFYGTLEELNQLLLQYIQEK